MRRMILSSLVLLPVMAHAEAGLNLAAAPAVATAVNTAYRVGASNGRTLEYAMFGSVPPESTIPSVTRAVGIGLSPAEMAGQPAVFNVIVKATVTCTESRTTSLSPSPPAPWWTTRYWLR